MKKLIRLEDFRFHAASILISPGFFCSSFDLDRCGKFKNSEVI